MKKITIIVPTYHVEKYIYKCLDSLVKQDYPDYEILVVNDGSPYGEQAIIDEFTSQYPFLHCLNKENGGYGSVLETAFKVINSDYVVICDGDDTLKPDALSILMRYQEETGAQMVVAAKDLVYEDSDEKEYDLSYNQEFGNINDHRLYKKDDPAFKTFYFFEPSPHAKLYPLNIVANIKFPTKVSYTDNLLYFYTLNKINSIVYCKEPLANYLINRQGNTRTDLKPTIIDSMVLVFKSILAQSENADAVFYYRMFEAFYDIYYKVDNINADNSTKLEKYNLIYSYLQLLQSHRDDILAENKYFNSDSGKMLAQKENLLDPNKSKITYYKLVNQRLYGSLKEKIKNLIEEYTLLNKIYNIYHFHAKYFYTRNDPKIILNKHIKAELIDPESINFFGYYDKPCVYNHKVLYLKTNSKHLSYTQKIEVWVDQEKIGETTAWNFQQGAMESWFDDKHIIYNFCDGEAYRSKLVNINTLEEKIYCFPIYSLAKNRKYALSLNFKRLAKLRKDYGYFNLPYASLADEKEDGVFYLDLIKNEVSLLLSLAEIKNFRPHQNMANAIHKVNHIDISPDSKKAIFLHRWYVGKNKYTRLLLLDIETRQLKVLADRDMVSHMAWLNNELLFGYFKRQDNKDGYAYIDLRNEQEIAFNHPVLIDDGHPTSYKDRYIVVDTYPDYTCKSKLYLIDRKDNSLTLLGQFYAGKKYQNDKRCDLHPRFDYDDSKLTIDTVYYNNQRHILHLDLKELMESK